MKKLFNCILLALPLFFSACGNNENKKADNTTNSETTEQKSTNEKSTVTTESTDEKKVEKSDDDGNKFAGTWYNRKERLNRFVITKDGDQFLLVYSELYPDGSYRDRYTFSSPYKDKKLQFSSSGGVQDITINSSGTNIYCGGAVYEKQP